MTQQKQSSYAPTVVKISGILLLICAIIAGIVSFVYSLTIDAYRTNEKNELEKNLREIYDALEDPDFRAEEYVKEKDYTVYRINKGGETLLCVNVAGKGFSDLNVIVGYDANLSILGIKVSALGETPGIGTRATEEAHLSQYKGKTGELTMDKGADVEAISGATISSEGIHAAINRANVLVTQYASNADTSDPATENS